MKTPNGEFSDSQIANMAKKWPPSRIATELGISESEVSSILDRLGITPINELQKEDAPKTAKVPEPKPKSKPKHGDLQM